MSYEVHKANQIGVLSGGQNVIDRPNSHIDEKMQSRLPNILVQISVTVGDKFVERTVQDNEVIGVSKVVAIDPNDKVFYAKRPKRFGYSKFVENREPEETNTVTVVLKQDEADSNTYILITAYSGEKAGLEPYDKRAGDGDREYWRTHAFVEKVTEYDDSTRTEVMPEYFK